MTIEGITTWLVDMPVEFKEEARVVWWIAACEELIAWHYHMVLTGFSCGKKGDTWLLVVRVKGRKGGGGPKAYVGFFAAETFWDCWRLFALKLKGRMIDWKDDKYR